MTFDKQSNGSRLAVELKSNDYYYQRRAAESSYFWAGFELPQRRKTRLNVNRGSLRRSGLNSIVPAVLSDPRPTGEAARGRHLAIFARRPHARPRSPASRLRRPVYSSRRRVIGDLPRRQFNAAGISGGRPKCDNAYTSARIPAAHISTVGITMFIFIFIFQYKRQLYCRVISPQQKYLSVVTARTAG